MTGGNFWQGAATGLVVSALNHAFHRNQTETQKLKEKIEKDGVITLKEAKMWWKKGNGLSLEADFSKIDFSGVTPSDFPNGVNSEEYINLFFKSGKSGRVYGTIKARYLGNHTIESASGYDIYDFNYDGRLIRDAFTWVGHKYNGSGTPYRINFYGGSARIARYSPYFNAYNYPDIPINSKY